MTKAKQTKSNNTTGHIVHTPKPERVLTTYQRQMLQQINNECGVAACLYVQNAITAEVPHGTIMHRLERMYKIMQGY